MKCYIVCFNKIDWNIYMNYQRNLEYFTVNKDVNYRESAKNMSLTYEKQRYLNETLMIIIGKISIYHFVKNFLFRLFF